MRIEMTVFLLALGVTIAVWVLRGVGLLTFLPGMVIWILLLITVGAGVVDIVQRTRRW